MAVSNSDDHLRNHGIIMREKGWRLSPVYDVNPVPYGNELSLNVNEVDNTISIPLAIDSATYFDITKKDAEKMAKEICMCVKNHWQKIAKQ